MKQKMDVCVIGGGPAGLAAAIALRMRGCSVIVADGAEPPIDKACGEGLLPDSVSALRELGIFIEPSEGRILRGICFLDDRNRVGASFPHDYGIGVRRPVLHRKMMERARQLGVTLLWKTPVTGLCREGVTAGSRTIAARWIIGADGIRSRVRRWSGLDHPYSRSEMRYATRRHYRFEPRSDYMEIYWGHRAQAYVTPVDADRVCVVMISRDPLVRFADLETEIPELAKALGRAAQEGGDRGAVTTTHRLDRVYRDNVALIGDASGSVDAITGEGLSLSFHQAMALADAVESGDLSRYQAAHRRLACRPTFMGRLLLLLDSQPRVRHRVMRALAAHPDVFARLLAVHVGATSPGHLAATGALLGWRFAFA
jgi:menaquinone-9 beta-reductase